MSRAAFLTLAAAAPLAALALAAPPDRVAAGLAVRPFGWPSLLVVHVLAAVPAAWLLARPLARRVAGDSPGPVAVLGVLLAGVGYLVADSVGGLLDDERAGFPTRAAVRTALCLLLALPWCVAASVPRRAGRTDPLAAAAAALVAVALPALYAERQAGQSLDEAANQLGRGRLVRAAPHLTAVADVSPARRVPGGSDRDTVAQTRAQLAAAATALTRDADLPPRKPSLDHAVLLISLDRLPEAEAYLRPMAAANPLARLRLGECLQLQERWAEGEAELRAAVAGLLPKADKPQVVRWCAEGYDLLAEGATRRHRPADREAVLREAVDALPAQAGYWRMQLGRHFKLSGRPFEALAEFDRAEAADGSLAPALAALRRDIREFTPGCLVR